MTFPKKAPRVTTVVRHMPQASTTYGTCDLPCVAKRLKYDARRFPLKQGWVGILGKGRYPIYTPPLPSTQALSCLRPRASRTGFAQPFPSAGFSRGAPSPPFSCRPRPSPFPPPLPEGYTRQAAGREGVQKSGTGGAERVKTFYCPCRPIPGFARRSLSRGCIARFILSESSFFAFHCVPCVIDGWSMWVVELG